MMIILDSDILIDILRNYSPAIMWLKSLGDEEILLPGYVVMEVLQGCSNKTEQTRVEHVLCMFETVWPLPESCEKALATFASFHLSHGMGFLDTLIGYTALALNLPLYTFNIKHYFVIPELVIVEPYQRV